MINGKVQYYLATGVCPSIRVTRRFPMIRRMFRVPSSLGCGSLRAKGSHDTCFRAVGTVFVVCIDGVRADIPDFTPVSSSWQAMVCFSRIPLNASKEWCPMKEMPLICMLLTLAPNSTRLFSSREQWADVTTFNMTELPFSAVKHHTLQFLYRYGSQTAADGTDAVPDGVWEGNEHAVEHMPVQVAVEHLHRTLIRQVRVWTESHQCDFPLYGEHGLATLGVLARNPDRSRRPISFNGSIR